MTTSAKPLTDADSRACFLRDIAATHGPDVYHWYEQRVRRHSVGKLYLWSGAGERWEQPVDVSRDAVGSGEEGYLILR
jgi:hypothetical protein